MQYLALIYESEARFANGYPETEMAEYGAFGKKHAGAIKAGNALQPIATAKTVRVRDTKAVTPMALLRKQKNNSADTICWRRPPSKKRQRLLPAFRRPATALSKSVPS